MLTGKVFALVCLTALAAPSASCAQCSGGGGTMAGAAGGFRGGPRMGGGMGMNPAMMTQAQQSMQQQMAQRQSMLVQQMQMMQTMNRPRIQFVSQLHLELDASRQRASRTVYRSPTKQALFERLKQRSEERQAARLERAAARDRDAV